MNNPDFILLIRRDHVLALAAHLAAGILALVLLTGAAGAGNRPVSPTTTTSAATAHR